ncbi:hypothetical protein MBLNU230_g7565t1 [Neophaeotheca triangularis]
MDFQITRYTQHALKVRPCGDPCHNYHLGPSYREKVRNRCANEKSLVLRKDGTWYTVHTCNLHKALKCKTTLLGEMREVQDGEDNEEDWEEMEGGDEEEPKERGLGEPRVKKVLAKTPGGEGKSGVEGVVGAEAVATPVKKVNVKSPKTPGGLKRAATTSPSSGRSTKKVRFSVPVERTSERLVSTTALEEDLVRLEFDGPPVRLELGGTADKPVILLAE